MRIFKRILSFILIFIYIIPAFSYAIVDFASIDLTTPTEFDTTEFEKFTGSTGGEDEVQIATQNPTTTSPTKPADENPTTVNIDPLPVNTGYHIYRRKVEERTEYISGNVKEYLGEVPATVPGTDSKTKTSDVSSVTVELLNSSKQVIERQITSSDGSFNFRPEDEGMYYLRFKLGYIDDTYAKTYNPSTGITNYWSYKNLSNNKLKDILKYNGQDYVMQARPDGANGRVYQTSLTGDIASTKTSSNARKSYEKLQNNVEWEIAESGRGAAQVIFALDCSSSMYKNTTIDKYGRTVTRLEAQVNNAIELIESMIASDRNIYIGLVFFKGDAYRAMGLSQNETYLKNTLLDIVDTAKNTEYWVTAYTDVKLALQKAQESFISDSDASNSNRNIILMTDGLPTKADGIFPYGDDSEETIRTKMLQTIPQSTSNKMLELLNNGINIFTILSEPTAQGDITVAHTLYENYSNKVFDVNSENIINELYSLINEQIQTPTVNMEDEGELTQDIEHLYNSNNILFHGIENLESRTLVLDDNFDKIFYYDQNEKASQDKQGIRTKLFKLIDSYSASKFSQAQELSNLSYISYTSGPYYLSGRTDIYTHREYKEVEYHPVYETYSYTEEVEDEEGNITTETRWVTEYDHTDIIHNYTDYILKGYSAQNLLIAKKPTTKTVITASATGLKVTLASGGIIYDKSQEVETDQMLIYSLEEELALGSMIDVEYTLKISNPSSIQLNYIELVAYIPDELIYKGQSLSEDGSVSYELEKVTNQELIEQGYIIDEAPGGSAVRLKLGTQELDGSDDFFIPPNGEYITKFYASARLTSLENAIFDNKLKCEVLGYSNSSNRRMTLLKAVGEESVFEGIYPGDFEGEDNAVSTNIAQIIPVTGLSKTQRKMYTIKMTIVCSLIAIILVGVLVIIILKVKQKA